MWELNHNEGWTLKNWCWQTILRIPWTARRSNQSILKEINPDYSLEGLKLKSNILATWWEEPSHWKRPWCWERLRPGGEGGDRGWDGRMASPPQWTWIWANSGSWWRTGRPGVLRSMGSQRLGHDLATVNRASPPHADNDLHSVLKSYHSICFRGLL